jgi:hypothetical protein
LREILVGFPLNVSQGAKDDSVALLGELVRDECLHAPQEEVREQVLDQLFGCRPGNAELLERSVMRLADG